jgi:hypothetical protein
VAHDREMSLFTSLFNLLYSIRVRRGGEDRLCWISSRRGLFDVRPYYNVLVPHDNTPFPWEEYLAEQGSLKSSFFAWSVALGKILITDNLRKRYIIVVE